MYIASTNKMGGFFRFNFFLTKLSSIFFLTPEKTQGGETESFFLGHQSLLIVNGAINQGK